MANVNELPEFVLPEEGRLVPTVYSHRKFIAYIARLLGQQGGLTHKYSFTAGKDIEIKVRDMDVLNTAVTISALDSVPLEASATGFTAEYGQDFPQGTQTIQVKVKRGSYPLVSIAIPDAYPPISLGAVQLAQYLEGHEVSIETVNGRYIDGNAREMIIPGTASDSVGNTVSIVSPITRRTRHFWGAVPVADPSYFSREDSSSILGAIPGRITVNHGPTPTHFIIATDREIEVQAHGLTVGTTMFRADIRPFAARPDYTKEYYIYISTGTSTGNYTYQIK